MSGIRILLIFTIFISVGCNVLPGETKFPKGTPTPGYTGPDALNGVAQIHTLPASETTATACEVFNLQNATVTAPCSCSAGVCTIGLKGNTGLASFNYRYYSNGTRLNAASGNFNIKNMVPFVSTWRVGDAFHGDGDLTVTLPLRDGFQYNFTVDWGDGNTDEVTSFDDPDIDHTYSSAGDYTITISGLVGAWYFIDTGDKDKIISISELGTVGWKSFEAGFNGCAKLTTVAGGDTSSVTNMKGMFSNASQVSPNTSGWDTSNVTTMYGMFFNAFVADPDTSNWDTSSVTDMSGMFYGASAANPDTSVWNTSSVTNMSHMFADADTANPNTSSWDTSNVTDMSDMFKRAVIADPDTSNWDTSKVTDMSSMFYDTPVANPDTSNWDTSIVTNMSHMFAYANTANPDTTGWNTLSVTNMAHMFNNAVSAYPDTSAWSTSNVTNMVAMFNNASLADPDMSGWDFSSVTNLTNMFTGVTLSTVNYDNMLIRLDATAPSNLTIDAGSSTYTSAGAGGTARANLIGDGWTITDGGGI